MLKNPAILKKIKHGGIKSLIKRALEKGINVKIFSKDPFLIKLNFEEKDIIIRGGSVPLEKRMGDMTRNKNLTKMILENMAIHTPRGIVADSLGEAVKLVHKKKLKYPLIVKPLSDSLARGVTWDIRSRDELIKAVHFLYKIKNLKKRKKFLVEEMFLGDEYRILVFNGKVISCVKKIPASVIGDGKSKIRELIERFNKKRMKGFEIKIDKIVKKTLKKNKLNLESVLPKNYHLKLRHNLNMSDGGRSINYTQVMNKNFKVICERAIEAVGLTYGGIDLLTKDIASKGNRYVIIEINSNPYYNMHEKPLIEGKGVDVSLKILKHLFSKLK